MTPCYDLSMNMGKNDVIPQVERAETSDHGQMERQMHVIEQKRRTLLQDFLHS